MPSGKVHDLVTIGLGIPVSAAAFAATGSSSGTLICAAAFLFGGLMFGPDLDTRSSQYSRWGPVRPIWFPYRHLFPHRSRLSHGLALGAFIRVVYFLGVISLILLAVTFAYQSFAGGALPGAGDIVQFWTPVGVNVRVILGDNALVLAFVGLWIGAASHTLTDLIGSFIKTGSVGKFF